MPKLLPRQYGKILYRATEGLDKAEREAVVKSFVTFVAHRHQLRQMDKIVSAFIIYAREQAGEGDVTVVSARPLTERLARQIATRFGAGASATSVVQENLIGGVVVRTRTRILDGSLRTTLTAMKKIMLNSQVV